MHHFRRIAIDDVFASACPDAGLAALQKMRLHPAIRGLAICLDQIANRADTEAKQGRTPSREAPEHAGDLASAAAYVVECERAAVVARLMFAAVSDQFPVTATNKKSGATRG